MGDVFEAGHCRAAVGARVRLLVVCLSAHGLTQTTPAPQLCRACPPWQALVSFRVKEARGRALAMKAALEARGVPCFCSETDIPNAEDW